MVGRRGQAVCVLAIVLLALACREPRVVPCGLGGLLGKPDSVLKHLRPAAVSDLGIWKERLDCENFESALYTMGNGVAAITLVTASAAADDKQVPLSVAGQLVETWRLPERVGVEPDPEGSRGPAVVLEWHWEDEETLGALRVPGTLTPASDCILIVQLADVKPPFQIVDGSCESALALIPQLRGLGISCP